MANEQITFDKLPQAVGYLTEQMEQIRQMVAALQPQASSDKHRLIEIDEACKITRKAKPTIYTLARKGLIPAYKRGKKLYFMKMSCCNGLSPDAADAGHVTSGTGCGDSTWSETQTKGRL